MKDISVEPNLKFKKKSVENNIQLHLYKKKQLPLPTEIEISESGVCNRKCSFCPRSDPNYQEVNEFISAKISNSFFRNSIDYTNWFINNIIDKLRLEE